MLFRETINSNLPTIILLHGGGLSDWSWNKTIDMLKTDFNIVTPIIDGHGENGSEDFISIEDSASKVIKYIERHYNGKVFAIGGLSIGAQITTEILSKKSDIADYAIIESALVYPRKCTTALTVPTYKLFYGLIKKRWFAKIQAKTLCVPDNMLETYYKDSIKISKQTLTNICLSNGNYPLKPSIADTTAKVLVIVGSKELGIMKKSADLLHETIKGSTLFVAQGMQHCEISLKHTDQYIEQLKLLFAK